jgi:hypothetical protein
MNRADILEKIYRDLKDVFPPKLLEYLVECRGLRALPAALLDYVDKNFVFAKNAYDVHRFMNTSAGEKSMHVDDFFAWWQSISLLERIEFLEPVA